MAAGDFRLRQRTKRCAEAVWRWLAFFGIGAACLIWFVASSPEGKAGAPADWPAAACLQRNFIIFFNLDGKEPSDDGLRVIAAAAAHWRKYQATRILISGYTDGTGSARHNQSLSEQRAERVADMLAGMGVPRNRMVVSGYGIKYPRIPVPGAEIQNRRVQIIFP